MARSALAYVAGTALVGYGCWLLLSTRSFLGLEPVVRWLVGGLVAHDLLAVPLALVAGALVVRFLPAAVRAPVQAGLFVSAAVTLAALPYVLGHGSRHVPYDRNLLVLLAAVWCVVAGTAAVRALRRLR